MAPNSTSQVRVAVRIRPLTDEEHTLNGQRIVDVNSHASSISISSRKYTFDSVFDESLSQSSLYSHVRSDGMLENFLDGFNVTIMAYGQTGSGKTHTMGSEATSQTYLGHDNDNDGFVQKAGLIPRFMNDIFSSLHDRKIRDQEEINNEQNNSEHGRQHQNYLIEYQVSASFLEVHNENIYDLLGNDSRKELPLREDGKGGIVVGGLKEQKITSAQDALQVLHDGTLNRTTAATLMNKKSSRSHAVFTVILKQTTREVAGTRENGDKEKENTMDVTTTSRFTFVDLAGSERMKKTGAEGERAKEGIKINQGLLALGSVINALADEERVMKGEHIHVPYRQSKLTRLLQDALGGNSQTLFLACVSPCNLNASETLSTLKYANRAKNIKNAPTKNVDATIAEMQRLYALTSVMEKELVRVKFSSKNGTIEDNEEKDANESIIGAVPEDLFQDDDVKEYLNKIRQVAAETKNLSDLQSLPSFECGSVNMLQSSRSTTTGNSATSSSANRSLARGAPTSLHSQPCVSSSQRRQHVVDQIDENILGVNPDEDIALLDKLLELQHLDQEYDKEAKKDQEKLEEVEGELQAQEQLLLQLKDNMKGYHNLKDRFETMMVEVQGLEAEKERLAKELESAQVDPSKGCSKAIKKRLDEITAKLARTRSESRIQQQKYRKAEQEAQKAKILQRKIEDLKHGKVSLMKKQREATAKYRETTEAKTREIQSLKKKERKNGQRMSKLESEIQKQKANLDKRKAINDKLSEKLKKTEAHLMKVLAQRKRETAAPSRKYNNIGKFMDDKVDLDAHSDEIDSLRFLLEKLLMDRVSSSVLRTKFEEKANEHSDLMRTMVEEMKLLKHAKEELNRFDFDNEEGSSEIEQAIKDSKETIEDIELRLEVVEGEMEDIKSRFPCVDSEDGELCNSKYENDAMKMIANLSKPVSKTLLWNMIEVASQAKIGKATVAEKLRRKEATLSSYESEIQRLNQQIVSMSENIEKRKSFDSFGPRESFYELSNKIAKLESELEEAKNEKLALVKSNEIQDEELKKKRVQISFYSEQLTIMKVTLANEGIEVKNKIQETVDELQVLWDEIGLSPNERELARSNIENCLALSCEAAFEEAKKLKSKCLEDIASLKGEIQDMYETLDLYEDFDQIQKSWNSQAPLQDQIENLITGKAQIIPTYNNALKRRNNMVTEVEGIIASLALSDSSILDRIGCDHLAALMKQSHIKKKKKAFSQQSVPTMNSNKDRRATQFKLVEDMVRALDDELNTSGNGLDTSTARENGCEESGSLILSDDFFTSCEEELKKLRDKKWKMKMSNQTLRDASNTLASQMHLGRRELLSMSIHSMKKKMKDLPSWWDSRVAEEVCRSIASKEAVVKVSPVYTKHLEAIHECITSISKAREVFSNTLQTIVRKSYEGLFQNVSRDFDTNMCSDMFDSALARLPPLSKEVIDACIKEMETLIEVVDAMSQSGVEALTCLWDSLNASRGEKGDFWGAVEKATKDFQSVVHHDFEEVLKSSSADIEEWILHSAKEAQKLNRQLNISQVKMKKINDEVERLRLTQSNKNSIMSLNAEICILSAKLSEFEEQANSKQRLMKKTNSTSLLKEEKYRKQMQTKFTQKLNLLSQLVEEWECNEGIGSASMILSEEVAELLSNPDGVEKRTARMHLKTVPNRPTRDGRVLSSSSSRRPIQDSNLSDMSSRPSSRASSNDDISSTSLKTVKRVNDRSKSRIRSTANPTRSRSNVRRKSPSPVRPRTASRATSKSPVRRTVRKNVVSPKMQRTLVATKSTNEMKRMKATVSTSRLRTARDKSSTRNEVKKNALETKDNTFMTKDKSPMVRKNKIKMTKKDSPILPFGNLLTSPRGKENFKF
ncbi:kinesin family member 4/21/27 [Chaetoceros tenuissimus]|uniref:Kinesin family member 4/21/27 n=1 Tax=Chaetoceros tenuissimus TaxID=426638 RepID=A0AAD3CHJ3_9STRA|nr:kinesin family member 4/21/27 [Chaetoceros tenuissimus]